MEICFFQSGPKLVLVGRLSCSRGDKSVAHPTDRRHSCRRWWAWKSVSSRRGQNLFWWGGSRAAGATRVSPIRRTGGTPVADGGHGNLFLPVGAKTCFSGEAPMQHGRQECRPSDGPATLLSPMVGMEIRFFPSGPKLVLVGRLPYTRGNKSVAHPTDRRHSCRRWWAWKSVSSRRGQNLF